MDNPTITVIVPICDVDAYLSKCIESIIQQTYKRLEIILIDDGSQDLCPQKCDEYASKDERIQVIHKKNEGLSSARNAGLDIATGEYVSFVDGDDWLEQDMYEQMLEVAEKTEADMVTCDVYFWKYGTQECRTNSGQTNKQTIIEDNDELFRHILEPNPTIKFVIWNKLFRRTVIGDTRFKDGQRYEDIYFDRMVFGRVGKCVAIDRALYNYLQGRPGSTISSFNEDRLCKLDELDEYVTMFNERKRPDIAKMFRRCAAASALYLYGQAIKFGYGSDLRRLIHKRFCDYYSVEEKWPLKYILFKKYPVLLCYLYKIKGKILANNRIGKVIRWGASAIKWSRALSGTR